MSTTGSDAARSLSPMEEMLRAALRDVIREEVRTIVREELASALASVPQAADSDGAKLYVSMDEAAEIANVSARTVRRWVQTRELPATEIGRVVRIRRAVLEDFLARGGGSTKSTKSADEIAISVLSRRRG